MSRCVLFAVRTLAQRSATRRSASLFQKNAQTITKTPRNYFFSPQRRNVSHLAFSSSAILGTSYLIFGTSASQAVVVAPNTRAEPVVVEKDDASIVERAKNKTFNILQEGSFGTLIGFATGYALKVLGRGLLVVFGLQYVVLQILAYKNFVTVNWQKILASGSPLWDKRRSYFDAFVRLLTSKIPFKAGFVGGMYMGLTSNLSHK
eukprot:TRINITY_DN788_c0_g1_i1.p1 TRINITY_DN788_c0_g1~~TRINITY_DN788_c0_g1_i1.p1  ORF type:complete len:205 (-),score=26.10 TRINITY_DN788_c0_g1_i1:132-746(-)